MLFTLLPEMQRTATEAWRHAPFYPGTWRRVSEEFIRFDAALRIAALLAQVLPQVRPRPLPYRTVDRREAGVLIGGLAVIVRGRLAAGPDTGYVDLEIIAAPRGR
jgi:hypothetical protein